MFSRYAMPFPRSAASNSADDVAVAVLLQHPEQALVLARLLPQSGDRGRAAVVGRRASAGGAAGAGRDRDRRRERRRGGRHGRQELGVRRRRLPGRLVHGRRVLRGRDVRQQRLERGARRRILRSHARWPERRLRRPAKRYKTISAISKARERRRTRTSAAETRPIERAAEMAAIETDSPMEIRRRQHGSAREVRIAERSQAGRVELFVAKVEERMRRQRRRHHGRGRHLRPARQIRVVRMARRADFLLLSPLGAAILEPDLQRTEKSRD